MKLTREQLGLVFDCCLPCTGQGRKRRGFALIQSNPKAAQTYTILERAMAQMNAMKEKNCPDDLVDLTIARLKLATMKRPCPIKMASNNPEDGSAKKT